LAFLSGLIEPIIERINDENRIKYRLIKKGDAIICDIAESEFV